MLREHELRRHIVGEMHLRRWPSLSAPMRIVQILRLVEADMREAEFAAVLSMPPNGAIDPQAGKRHIAGHLTHDVAFTWERHSEASSVTLFAAGASDEAMAAAIRWAEGLPGATLRATRIDIVVDERSAEAMLPGIAFDPSELVSCHIAGHARIWSDFHIAPDGYGRLLIAANGLDGGDLTRAVQRVQELGNYRNLALLGLPVAQACWPLLDDAEAQLRQLGEELVETDIRDDQLMAHLSALSLEIARIASSANYRISATAAYGQLVEERLHDLAPEPIRGFPSLVDFTQRRLFPGVRTCAAFGKREQQVATRAAQFTGLLRTRIETRIENQNGRLLASLERSAATQLRLQHLVEGLSVVAISYYAVSLIGHVLAGFGHALPGFPDATIEAVLTPLVVIVTAFGMRTMRHRVLGRAATGGK